jgi:single-stranded-DNA-specific exonuclease
MISLRQRYGLDIITEEDIGFKIAPLINCAGRMSDPSIALEFLLSFDEFEANMQLDYLIELNEMRKQEQLQIFNEAKEQVDENDKVIVVASQNWNEGIIGIVASKLCEKYKKPSIVFSINETKAKASARSTAQVNLYELIASCSEVLNGYGGHKQAAGLSIDKKNITQFKDMINKNIEKQTLLEEDIESNSLGHFCVSEVGENIYNLIETYRPYGITNPYPIFTFSDTEVLSVVKMGKNKEYTKLEVSNGNNSIEVVVFTDFDEIVVGQKISFTANISKNEFRGEVKFNLMFKELL